MIQNGSADITASAIRHATGAKIIAASHPSLSSPQIWRHYQTMRVSYASVLRAINIYIAAVTENCISHTRRCLCVDTRARALTRELGARFCFLETTCFCSRRD
jgi:hypothetical protein